MLLCPPSKQKWPPEFARQAAIVCSIESGAKLGNALPNRFATGCRQPDTSPTPRACPLVLKSATAGVSLGTLTATGVRSAADLYAPSPGDRSDPSSWPDSAECGGQTHPELEQREFCVLVNAELDPDRQRTRASAARRTVSQHITVKLRLVAEALANSAPAGRRMRSPGTVRVPRIHERPGEQDKVVRRHEIGVLTRLPTGLSWWRGYAAV